MAYKCNECGDEIASQNGRYGHFRFTDGGGHGPKGEVPDDYKDKFSEIESDGEDPDPEEGEGNDSSGDSDAEPAVSGSEESSPSPDDTGADGGSSESDSGSRSLGDRIKTALDTDLRELI